MPVWYFTTLSIVGVICGSFASAIMSQPDFEITAMTL